MAKKFAIIFDCDGTLVDSLGQAMESFNYALDKMGEPLRTPEEIKKYFGAAADRIFFSVLGDKDKALRAFELYMDHQSVLAKKTQLHVGIRSLLDALAARGVPLAVVTGRHARDLEVVLEPHRLASYFKVLIADSQLPHSKPAPDGILLAARSLALPPEQCIYVGDSVTDVQAAHNAGAIAVAALWDALAKKEELRHAKPRFLASVPGDILTIYEGLVGR